MIIHKCDKCGKTVEQAKGRRANLPKDWYGIEYKVGYSRTTIFYEVCPECRIALKIPDKEPDQTVGEQLLDLISEVATEEVQTAMENI